MNLTSSFCPDLYKCGLALRTDAGRSLSRIPLTTGGTAVKMRLKKINDKSSIKLEPENPLYNWNQNNTNTNI